MAVFEILQEIIDRKGISIAEIARICNLSDSTVRGIIKRKQETIALEVAFKLSDGLGISLECLNGMPERETIPQREHILIPAVPPEVKEKLEGIIKKYRSLDRYGQEAVDGVLDVEWRRCTAPVQENDPENEEKIITLLFDDQKASAGSGYELDNDRLIPWKVKYNELTRKADFCVEVDGHSMEPMFMDGDIILVRQQPAVEIGEIGLFVADEKGFVKKQGNGYMISVNPEFDDIFPENFQTVFCRGRVIGVLKPEWIVEK